MAMYSGLGTRHARSNLTASEAYANQTGINVITMIFGWFFLSFCFPTGLKWIRSPRAVFTDLCVCCVSYKSNTLPTLEDYCPQNKYKQIHLLHDFV